MTETIGFIGLGNLGAPIAANLLAAGHALRVYNRTAAKADDLVERGAVRADRPADATAGLTCPLDAVMIVSATATTGARATKVVTRHRRLAVALRARRNPTTANNPLSQLCPSSGTPG